MYKLQNLSIQFKFIINLGLDMLAKWPHDKLMSNVVNSFKCNFKGNDLFFIRVKFIFLQIVTAVS